MDAPRPVDLRDHYLDALSQAQAQGRVAPGQFAARVDAILCATSRQELDAALMGLRPQQRPGVVMPVASPAMVAPPVRPDRRQEASGARGWARRDALIVGGGAVFLALFGVGVARVAARGADPYGYSLGAAPSDGARWSSFFERGAMLANLDGTPAARGAISEIEVTPNWLSVLHTTPDGVTQRTTVELTSGYTSEPMSTRPQNTFVISEISLAMLDTYIERTAVELKLPVTRLVINRFPGDAKPRVIAYVTPVTYAAWDAATNNLIQIVRG